jgi:hypothetical protein
MISPSILDDLVEALEVAEREIVARVRAYMSKDGFPAEQISATVDTLPALVRTRAALAKARQAPEREGFQQRVDDWLIACFGEQIARDKVERNHRFLEEALELVQACGCTASEAHQLVDYTYGRPVGEIGQEVGGVMNTLAALCLAYGRDMARDGDTEIARCWTKVEQIRAKQAAKPKHSPLPQAVRHVPITGTVGEPSDGVVS